MNNWITFHGNPSNSFHDQQLLSIPNSVELASQQHFFLFCPYKFSEHLLPYWAVKLEHLIMLSITLAFPPGKQQWLCLACLGPHWPTAHWDVSVTVHAVTQREGWEAQGHTNIAHTVRHTHWQLQLSTVTEATQASPRALFYKAMCVKRCSVFFHSRWYYFPTVRRGCSPNASRSLSAPSQLSFLGEPQPMDDDRWGLSGKTEAKVKYSHNNVMTRHALHSCSMSGITQREKKTCVLCAAVVIITHAYLPLSRLGIWTQSSTMFGTWLH